MLIWLVISLILGSLYQMDELESLMSYAVCNISSILHLQFRICTVNLFLLIVWL